MIRRLLHVCWLLAGLAGHCAAQVIAPTAPAPVLVPAEQLNPAAVAPVKPSTSPAPKSPGGTQIKIETLSGTKNVSSIHGLDKGILTVIAGARVEMPLDQILQIQWQNDDSLSVLWIGQDRYAEGRDVPDMHVRLRGLKRGTGIREVAVSGPWRPPGSRKPELKRAAGATVADLYYEPPEQDDFGKKHYLTVTYDDGSSPRVLYECTSHTSKSAQGAEKRDAARRLTLFDVDGGRISGTLLGMDEQFVRLKTSWSSEIRVPRSAVTAYRLFEPSSKVGTKEFEAHRSKPTADDVALVLFREVDASGKSTPGREKAVNEVAGTLLGIADGKLQFRYEGENRTIGLERVIGVVARKAGPRKPSGPQQSFELANGDVLVGTWQGLAPQDLKVAVWGSTLQLPRKWVDSITFRNGKLTYLSDLTPEKVEQTAYFDRVWPYRRNRSLAGGPLVVGGVQYPKGLAVHSRTVLSYTLDPPCNRFQTLVGFDDQAGRNGRVSCRVLADGKTLWKAEDLRATEPPQKLDLDIAGIRALVLEVDFGQDADVGDRVVWADPRLLRDAAP